MFQLEAAEKVARNGSTAVVICNGKREGEVILDVMNGRQVGTLITSRGSSEVMESVDVVAEQGKSLPLLSRVLNWPVLTSPQREEEAILSSNSHLIRCLT